MKDGRNASCKMEQPIYLFLLFLLCTVLGRLLNDISIPQNSTKQESKNKWKQLVHYNKQSNQDKNLTQNKSEFGQTFFQFTNEGILSSLPPKIIQNLNTLSKNENAIGINAIIKTTEQFLLKGQVLTIGAEIPVSKIEKRSAMNSQNSFDLDFSTKLKETLNAQLMTKMNEEKTNWNSVRKCSINIQQNFEDMGLIKQEISFSSHQQKAEEEIFNEHLKSMNKQKESLKNTLTSCPTFFPNFLVEVRWFDNKKPAKKAK